MGIEVQNYPIVYMSPTALMPYYRNSKRHDRRQITLLAKAIRTTGFDQPIVVDKDRVIIKGHGRRLAAIELKMELVPVVVREDLTPEQVKASRIADNQAATMSKIDKAKEQLEIKDYVKAGGTDAAIFFDFMDTSAKAITPPGAASPIKQAKDSISGHMETCPKCGHTFLEVKK